jgi:hypothetical protein
MPQKNQSFFYESLDLRLQPVEQTRESSLAAWSSIALAEYLERFTVSSGACWDCASGPTHGHEQMSDTQRQLRDQLMQRLREQLQDALRRAYELDRDRAADQKGNTA